ncbi:hypothetical protein [Parabacteroides sp.]
MDIPVNDDSYRYRAIMQAKKIELHYSLPGHVEVPTGSYIEFQGERYTLWYPENFEKKGTRIFDYKVIFGGNEEILKKYKYKLLTEKPYKLKFPMTAKPALFLKLLVENLNLYDSGWTVGNCIESAEKLLSFNHENCWTVLGRLAQEFNTEFEVVNKTIHLGKLEKFKDNPVALSYGKGNGFIPGVGRTNLGDNLPVEILYVQGGEKNIDFSSYGSQTLLLPKSQTLEYEGRTYKTDPDGMYVTRADKTLSSRNEDSFDANHIYPSRVGMISKMDTLPGKDSDGKDLTFYNIFDSDIPAELDFANYQIKGQNMTVIFQSGRLTGREFDVKYIHKDRKFEIVPNDQDGHSLPNSDLYPQAGDKYAVFNISLPAAYICDNTSKTGASWDMLKEAVRYLYEHEEQQFTFSGSLDGIWAKKNWLAIGAKLVPGGYVDFSDTQFQPQGILIRITGVRDYINKPHSPELELSNTPVSGFLQDQIGKLEAEEIKNEKKHKEALALTMRRWRDMVETGKMLENAIEGFSASINPITVSTMQARIGSEQLQYRYVNNKTNPIEYLPNFEINNTTKVFIAPAGIIQHMTLGIDSISTSHNASEYMFWDIVSYTSPYLGDDKSPFYLYLKCAKNSSKGTYLLTKEAYPHIEPGDGYYYFLVGTLGTEFDGKRSWETIYGYTEILPGRLTTKLIKSPDGSMYIDLVDRVICGNMKFLGGTTGYDNIKDKPDISGIVQGVNDALSEAEAASNAANNAQGIANSAQSAANSKARVFYSDSTPSSGMKTNDLWVDGTNIYRYDGGRWVFASAYDNSETKINGGLITTGAIAVGPKGNPTGGICGSGTIRIWSGGGCNNKGIPTGPTFQVESDGTVTAKMAIKLMDNMAGITGAGTSSNSVRFWAGSSVPSNAPFRVTQNGDVYMAGFKITSSSISSTNGKMVIAPSTGVVFDGGSSYSAIGRSVLPASTGTVCPAYIKNTEYSGGYFGNGMALRIDVGRAAYKDTPQRWIECVHAAGWGSKFILESRYFNDQDAMERTVINVGSMMTHVQLEALSPSPELYPVYVDNKSGYLCLKY